MPFLAALLGQAFAAVVAWLAQFVGKKVATAIALGSFLVAGWVGLSESLYLIQQNIAVPIPPWAQPALGVAGYLLPSNVWTVAGAIISAKWARQIWDNSREWATKLAAA